MLQNDIDKCDCNYKNAIVLDLPDSIATYKQNRIVSIDKCIANVMEYLFSKEIDTASQEKHHSQSSDQGWHISFHYHEGVHPTNKYPKDEDKQKGAKDSYWNYQMLI